MFIPTENTFLQALRYLLFAGTAAITNVISRYILSGYFSIAYYISISIAYVLGLFVNFFLNSNYNFPKSDRSNKQVLHTFFIIGLGGLILTEFLSHILLHFFEKNFVSYNSETIETMAHIVAVGMVFIYSFFAHKYFTYRDGIWKTLKTI
tara:strand:- start:199 stop:648 length:450 start_codon:yes stop_codon:yes gene_type:complete